MLDLSSVQYVHSRLENMSQEANLRHDRMDDNILRTYVVQIIVFLVIFSSVLSNRLVLTEEVLLGIAASCTLLFIAIIYLQCIPFMSKYIGLGSCPSFWLKKEYLEHKGDNENKHVLAKALLELIIKKQEAIKDSIKSLEYKKKKLKVSVILTACSALCCITCILMSSKI